MDMSAVDRWLARPGARLRWRDEGPGEGTAPTLLLLHGWALDLDLWDPFARVGAGRLRLLRFDRRGYGLSTGTPSLEADYSDALALLDAAGVERCAVLGMSQGARVAAALALTRPGRFSHLVLDGAPALQGLADEDHEPEIPLEDYRRLLAERGAAALAVALASHPLFQLVTRDAATATLLGRLLARYPAHDLRSSVPHAAGDDAAAAALRLPTLVLNGAGDTPLRLRIGDALAAALPRSTRRLLPRAGHLACLDDPDGYAGVLLQFLFNTREIP
jgi:pimeloyl-ACP methyl ester carboxylesterase